MAAETGFLIDGTVYEVPGLMSLDMDERQLMFELAGFIQEDFLQESDESDKEFDERILTMMRNPGVYRALMTVAYQRGNPTVKPARVASVIARTNYMDAISTMLSADEEEPEADAVPLASTTEPAAPSPSDSVTSSDSGEDSNETSGNGSVSGSDGLDAHRVSIGTGRSGTSSLQSVPTESVA